MLFKVTGVRRAPRARKRCTVMRPRRRRCRARRLLFTSGTETCELQEITGSRHKRGDLKQKCKDLKKSGSYICPVKAQGTSWDALRLFIHLRKWIPFVQFKNSFSSFLLSPSSLELQDRRVWCEPDNDFPLSSTVSPSEISPPPPSNPQGKPFCIVDIICCQWLRVSDWGVELRRAAAPTTQQCCVTAIYSSHLNLFRAWRLRRCSRRDALAARSTKSHLAGRYLESIVISCHRHLVILGLCER